MDDYEREKVRKEIMTVFRINAYTPRKDGLDFCVEEMQRFDKATRTKWLDKIVATLRKQTLNTPVLTKEVFIEIFKQISNSGQKKEELFKVFDVFSIKQFNYDPECSKMIKSAKVPKISSDVNGMTTALRNRFTIVQQRAQRCKVLQQIHFSQIDSLLGCIRKRENVIILGMISQQKADCYHIEDLTGSIQANFSNAEFRTGLFTEGGIYMFEGTLESNIFYVHIAALVPTESADQTREHFGNENWFGGDDPIAFRCNKKLVAACVRNVEAAIVIVSDVHLDQPKVMRALYHMWSGFAMCPPVAFILCGNFCSRPRQPDTMELMEEGFRRLSNQLNEDSHRKAFADTHFIFVPGPDDPSMNMCLPRPHLPSPLLNPLKTLPNVLLASNPCRIQYGSKEIVVLRDDLVEKICRHTVNSVEQSNIPRAFALTVLSQANLSPLPSHIAPVLWDWGTALSLHPLPDLLVVADKYIHFTERESDMIVCNPGSFSTSSFGFHVYYPEQKKVDDSVIELE
ncbi:unnamed protein product [Auanema sp. JU1783]|nr:unnamed protein product [Auanema sp. JU1783]